jgi:hypothetical protein
MQHLMEPVRITVDKTKSSRIKGITVASFGFALLVLASLMAPAQQAQGQEMQQHLAEIKQSLAFNKQVDRRPCAGHNVSHH